MLLAHPLPQHLARFVASARPVLSACYLTLTNPHPLLPPSQGNLPWTQTRMHFPVGCLYSPQASSFTYYAFIVVLWCYICLVVGSLWVSPLAWRSTKFKVVSFLHIAIVTPQSSIKGSSTVPHKTSRSNNYLLLEFAFADEEGKLQRDWKCSISIQTQVGLVSRPTLISFHDCSQNTT